MKASPQIRHRLKMPRKAILLAAGFGTRMEPLSWDLPKPMMPLFGVPLLEHAILSLAEWGVEEVLINLHHAPHALLDWFRSRSSQIRLKVVFSYEPDILGTGGALRRAHFFVGTEPCWLVNTDIAFVLQPRPLVEVFQRKQAPAVLWLEPERGPRTVACDKGGVIRDYAVAHPGAEGTYTYCGIQLFHPRLIDALPGRAFCSVIDACRNMQKGGESVYGCAVDGSYWADLGTPERYLQVHAEAPDVLRSRGVKGSTADSVLWEGARILPGGQATRSILGRNVSLAIAVEDVCVVRSDLPGMDVDLAAVLRALHMRASDTLYMQLPRRGSDRNFVRLVDGQRRAIYIRYRMDRRPENARYAGHARFLAEAGVAVPRVLHEISGRGILVLEDVGSCSLLDIETEARDRWYRKLLPMVARLHSVDLSGCPPLEPPFDAALYTWEHELFLTQFLERHTPCNRETLQAIREELEGVAAKLLALPDVLVHRDLQSSNVLVHGGRLKLIDFQGMRRGPAVYDLASLLYDPYVALRDEQRKEYLECYNKGKSEEEARQTALFLPIAGIQRLAQALGAFGRLGAQAETRRFLHYIPAARRTMLELLGETGMCPALASVL